MKRVGLVLLAAALLSFGFSSIALAQHGDPSYACPPGFELHHAMEHDPDHEGMHHHIGVDTDKNGDGYICMRHVGAGGVNHLHIDNNLRLR